MTDGAKQQIKYEKDGASYMVQLSAHNDPTTYLGLGQHSGGGNGLHRLTGHPAFKRLQGEELVKALLTSAHKVDALIYKVERFKNGQPCDGPNGEPAMIEFSDKGLTVNHYKDGKLNDGPNGEAAVQVLKKGKNGYTPVAAKSYKDGVEGVLTGEAKYSVRTESAASSKPATLKP